MIVEKLFGFIGGILLNFLSLFNIPGLPDDLLESAHNFLDFLFSYSSLLGLFIRPNTIKVAAVLLLVILNFEHIYDLFKWVIGKLPFVNK